MEEMEKWVKAGDEGKELANDEYSMFS